jgi:ABC-type multidrug transport system fused ATPase/permease subunit
VALVPQEVELFAGSLRDNVTLFDDEPTDAAVIDALQRVGLGRLADNGIDRELGAAGAGLSAGEAQLLALARVWLRDPDIVVLDEATARVDPETERRLEAAVVELMRGRTTLVIAHRLSTLRSVDEIIVFDQGRIVEHGDRADLVGDDESRFARLLALALDSEAVDDAEPTVARSEVTP